MSDALSIHTVGGNGGAPFEISGAGNGATIKKIGVWAGGRFIKAVMISLTDGQSQHFGIPSGYYAEFSFEDGERFSSLSLWDNGEGTRLGAIKFKTNRSREFLVHMTDRSLAAPFEIDTCSGICVGNAGKAGAEIDCFAFIFIKNIISTVLTNINYPTLQNVIPNVFEEKILHNTTFQNKSSVTQEYHIKTKKIKKMSSWSVNKKMEATFNMEVKAGIPEVEEESHGFHLKVGTMRTYKLENSEESELQKCFVHVPPWKTMDVCGTIGQATINLPYKGTVQITCDNGSVLQYPTNGTYKGLTYTKANIVVEES